MIRSCEDAREIVAKYCEQQKSEQDPQDPEDINMAFFHIYYCMNRDNKCSELWFQLNKDEKNPDIRHWVEKWKGKPLAGITILGIGENGVHGIADGEAYDTYGRQGENN